MQTFTNSEVILPPTIQQPQLPNTQQPQTHYADIMTTGDWFITQFVLAIPLVNIIMLLVWGFRDSGNINRRNYCRATLIWMAIFIGLVLMSRFFAAM